MKTKRVRFKKGFRVVSGNARAQAASMVIPPGETEGGPDNNHRGADQWLFVVYGEGSARINGKKIGLRCNTLILIERGQNHEIQNTGTTDLVTLNFYVPPAYSAAGDELPPAKAK